jgi:hypothetical protein
MVSDVGYYINVMAVLVAGALPLIPHPVVGFRSDPVRRSSESTIIED